MKEELKDFAERLGLLRIERNLTFRELADETGIPKSSLHEYEKGNVDPSIKTVKILANYFDESIDYLIGVDNARRIKKIAQWEKCRIML